MARMPTPAAAPAGGAALAGAADPTMGAGADPGADDTDNGPQVVCTIAMNSDGSFIVYAGDEPDEGDGGGMSDDDAAALGQAGGGAAGGAGAAGGGAGAMGAMGGAGAGAPQGVPADSVGAALKAAMDILTEATSSAGGAGSSDDQFNSGYSGAGGPSLKQKYPSA